MKKIKDNILSDNDTRNKLLDTAFLEVYKKGYHGASVNAILKEAGVPKGSLYHFFPSKKELVLSVVKERIIPKMEQFFDFTLNDGESVTQSLERVFEKMKVHNLLIQNGCPLHRLIVEMAPLDSKFEKVLNEAFNHFVKNLSALFAKGIERGEYISFNTDMMARFFITSIWGELSLSPSLSSLETFNAHTKSLLNHIKQYEIA